MSCQVRQIANISDVLTVRRHLFPTDDDRGGDDWLQQSLVSVSPSGDLLVFAKESRLTILTGKWDESQNNTVFVSSYIGLHTFKDNIRSVLVLPIVLQSQNLQMGPDWTCIAVAFETGFVGFYTENGELLYQEQFHDEPIVTIKCQSQHNTRPDICPDLKPEEIYVIYESNICVISGPQLFSLLRTKRTELAKGESVSSNGQTAFGIKKWGFVDQTQVADAAVVGLDLQNTFDHLLTASLCGGFNSKYRAMPPHNNLVLGAGSKPFLGFHYALEGGAQPVLGDVVKAVASKVKSALPGWLTGNKTVTEKTPVFALQPAEAMACRFGLCDLRRQSNRIVLSPNRRLAAVSDALGRVLLIDTHRGVVLRIFKGYRDAQCAFMQVPDERKVRRGSKIAVALFLIIYCPKKGTLEIFSAQQGTKISTFTASKSSVLLYVNYGMMGFQTTSKSRYVSQFISVLVDPDGKFKEVVVPFHFALTEKNSRRARDLHLYKRLKQFIRTAEVSDEKMLSECLNTCKELRTMEVKLQFMEMLSACGDVNVDSLIACSEYFVEKLQSVENDCENDCKQLVKLTRNISLLSKFYKFFIEIDDDLDAKNGNVLSSNAPLLAPKEMKNLQRLLDLSTLNDYKMQPKVTFATNKEVRISDFLSVFDLVPNQITDVVRLKESVNEMKLFAVAETMFAKYITWQNAEKLLDDFEEHARKCHILPEDLFILLLHYWVNRPIDTFINLELEMFNFSKTVFTLTKLFDFAQISVPYNYVSPFWTKIRENLQNSHKPFPALLAAVLCKSVAQKIDSEKDQQSDINAEEDGFDVWEKLSQEHCEWTLLIGKLEDISLLNIIISNKPVCKPSLPTVIMESRKDVSLKNILDGGKGSVSEIVAQWLTSGGISPEELILDDLVEKSQELRDKEDPPVFYHLNILKKQFPYSLEPSVLLSNMCWEYALAWQKDLGSIRYLDAAVKCLTCIPNLHIKTGIYSMVWNTHIKLLYDSCCKLINKVGKLPKERLCKQDTDLSDYEMTLFAEICVAFFDGFMETLLESFSYERPQLQYEPIWENGGQPLAELALTQTLINYDLLDLHYQLSLVFHMMTVFGIKHNKILSNLFDLPSASLLFTDLQQKASLSNQNRGDSKVSASRLQFLIKVISSTMDTVTINNGAIYSTDHVAWMAKCLKLARAWSLDVDLLKRYQVVQIFAGGFDDLGIELLGTVADKQKLGPDLVTICGKRLQHVLNTSKDLGVNMSVFTTSLTNYLATLDGNGCAFTDLESTTLLVTNAIKCLDEKQPEYKIATLMLDACNALQDLN